MLHSLNTGSVPTSLDTLSDPTSPPPSSEPPPIPPSPEEEEEEEPTSPPPSPEQEVVDVESHQPCVVDLTHEDEDDVDVVAVVPREQSIIVSCCHYIYAHWSHISTRKLHHFGSEYITFHKYWIPWFAQTSCLIYQSPQYSL